MVSKVHFMRDPTVSILVQIEVTVVNFMASTFQGPISTQLPQPE